ncbi:Hypothetical protein FKW44_024503 [Caligus rogercresseyi]|uniref:Uncharacterized protein n=1 Tax=Caligus rogercresseyi TaxID=217165 RepID=A0A7T8GMC6_CALRO|nr:Hypothetical protein FKW44_024503 [Caligus rogercresseyi]
MCASSGVEPLPEPTLREQVQRFGVVLTYRSGVITEGSDGSFVGMTLKRTHSGPWPMYQTTTTCWMGQGVIRAAGSLGTS